MFVLGTQYLRGASPERDQWRRDMENIRNMGFNTIRAWMVWNALERVEGEIDADYLNSFLTAAKEFDLSVGLLFHMHACPGWAVKKYAKYFYMTDENLPFEPAVRPNTPSGGWPGLCFDHPEVREMEHRFITGVIAHTRKYDNVAFYEPMNEPHQWVDYNKKPNGIFCYCPASRAKFRLWLEKKYHDIETLNRAWGHFYGSFDEVDPPRWTHSYADYADFRLFTMDNVTEEIAYRTEIIRSADTKPVVAHAWGGGCVTCPQLGGMAFDDWKNARVFDKWGYSAFPKDAGDCAMLGLGCDATRSAAGGKEYWQSELTAGMNGTGLSQNGRIDDDTFDKFTLESIRHGAHGLLYWQYRRERFGAEWGGFAMTDYDGGETNLSRRASSIARMIAANDDIFGASLPPRAEVAIVFSVRSYLAVWSSNKMADNKQAVDSMSGYYKMFWEENIPCDILHEEIHGDLSKYKLIILPSPYAIAPAFAAELEKYVREGGTLLSEPYFGAFDGDFKLSYHVPGFGFDKIFGATEESFTQTDKCRLTGPDGSFTLTGNRHRETFRDVSGTALYTYEDGTPAVLLGHYGNGQAVLSGVNLGITYSDRALIADDFQSADRSNASLGSKGVVMKIAASAGVGGNLCTVPGVKVSVLRAQDTGDAIVILINSSKNDVRGQFAVDDEFSRAETLHGKCDAEIHGREIGFCLGADKSAVLRLYGA